MSGAPHTPIRVPRWPAEAGDGPDFAAIRAEFGVPEDFPPDVLAEAERRAREPQLPELDATDVPLVTLDPPGSRLAAPSLSTGGCSGVRRSGLYRVWPRRRASASIAPPGRTKAPTSAIA